jgi:hypothetical protein
MRLQSFADFPADCPAVQVVDIDAVAHDGTLVPREPCPSLNIDEGPAKAPVLSTNPVPKWQPRPPPLAICRERLIEQRA